MDCFFSFSKDIKSPPFLFFGLLLYHISAIYCWECGVPAVSVLIKLRTPSLSSMGKGGCWVHALSNRSIGAFRIPYDLWRIQSVLWLSWKFRTASDSRPLTSRGYLMAGRQYQLVPGAGVHRRTETIIILMGWQLPTKTYCLLGRLRLNATRVSGLVGTILEKELSQLSVYLRAGIALYDAENSIHLRFHKRANTLQSSFCVGFSVTPVSFSVRKYPFLTTINNTFLLFKVLFCNWKR